ncbi:hypothetical protein [Yoonia sp. 208BN28-4]|uniref:hypothetical protein n=1 Tax=Yoonia sp. 208BN28-4 TaxID=3126505 RepID=UPI0030A86A68
MIKALGCVVGLLAAPLAAAADTRPSMPYDLVIVSWSAQSAVFLAQDCDEFILAEGLDSVVRDYLQDLVDRGIRVEDYETYYAPAPAFSGDAV